MKNTVYYLDRPGGSFTPTSEAMPEPGPGEIRIRIRRTSVCQSDCVIYRVGLPRIKRWPAIVLHEVSATIDAVGPEVTGYVPGELIGLGCDIPCGDINCIHCGMHGTGDWTSCPNTQATGHEFPGFARTYAILPAWFVRFGPIMKFSPDISPDHACHLEPLACCMEGMTRVNNCIENRTVVLIGAGSQSTYALQCAQSMRAGKIILVNRGSQRLLRVLTDFNDGKTVGVHWDDNVVDRVLAECRPFHEPHFVMINAPAEPAYRLAAKLMGYGTVVDAHAGVKGTAGKPTIMHEVDLNNDIHYKLQCYQATHGSTMRGIRLAHELLNGRRLPRIDRMTGPSERFHHTQIAAAIARAGDSDSLKVIICWDD